jgi:hypothetical protein
MKKTFLFMCRSSLRAMGSLFSSALLLLASTGACGAQELLKNGNFEAPFPGTDPTNNWTVFFQEGGPGDFDITGPSTEACIGGLGYGAHLRNLAPRWTTKVYFKQVVTNVTVGAKYTLTIQKMKRGSYGKLLVWASLVSGITNKVYGDDLIDGPYSLAITSATPQIEVRLNLQKDSLDPDYAEDYRSINCWAHFDDCSLVLTP